MSHQPYMRSISQLMVFEVRDTGYFIYYLFTYLFIYRLKLLVGISFSYISKECAINTN